MKRCKSCGNRVNDEIKFCSNCGNNVFELEAYNQANGAAPSQNGNPYYSQAYQPQQASSAYQLQNAGYPNYGTAGNQVPVPPQPKKKNKAVTALIIIAVLIVLATIGFTAEKVFQAQDSGAPKDNSSYQSGNNSNKEDDEKGPEYTKGTFDGTEYVNEWADIKLVLPEGFSDADEETYAASQDLRTDCGAYFIADDTMSLIYICYEKLPAFPEYDDESYLDAVISNLEDQSSIIYECDKDYSTAKLAGYTYTVAEGKFNNGYGDFVQSMYVRKKGDRMIFICAVGVSTAANNALIAQIETVE